jgi:dethiobiotin synthetase
MEDGGSGIDLRFSIFDLWPRGFLMGNGLFITGTDTGVGKTFFACGLAALLKESGYRVGVMKPAETGCEERDGTLIPQDAIRLREASGCEAPLEKICPYPLREPLAPSVAAGRAGIKIDIGRVMNIYEDISAAHDITLVEGAGGLLVPVLPNYTYADVARILKLPVLVVAANRLGVINHLLLTLEHAGCRGLRVLGYVLNQMEREPPLAAETNREALSVLTAAPCIGELPYFDGSPSEKTSSLDLFEDRLELRLLESVLSRV